MTFGITSAKSGISKWSFITMLTSVVVVASAITHEETTTFLSEMQVLLDLYPSPAYHNWVLIVDGDPAKFKAARMKFERERMYVSFHVSIKQQKMRESIFDICAWHQRLGIEVASIHYLSIAITIVLMATESYSSHYPLLLHLLWTLRHRRTAGFSTRSARSEEDLMMI